MGWWTILLNKKNNEVYKSRLELLEKNQLSNASDERRLSNERKVLSQEHNRQKYMIYGEAIVFGIMLVLGIWLIYRTFKKEYALSQQQNNFLLSITHELKTPLASIGLTLDTFKQRELSKEQKVTLTDNALEETKRLETIVENLLVTSRIQNNPLLNKEKILIHALVSTITNKLQSQYPDRIIKNEISEHLTINADKESFVTVLKNIVENALKYSPDKSEITLRSFEKRKETIISCEDLGPGISDFEKLKVTEKFYRVGSEETRTTKGTGLGLYLADQIAKAHGHELKIADNTPKGTIVSITIPR